MTKEKIAKIISTIFHPFIIASIAVPLVVLEATDYNFSESSKWVLLIVIPLIILPILYLFYLKKSNKIEDFDLSNKEQRHKFYPLAVVLIALILGCLKLYNAPNQIFLLILSLIIVFIVNYLINRSSKISIHTSAIIGFSVLLFIYFGIKLGLIGLFLSAIVMWSRILLKKHSQFEILSAAIITFMITYSIFALFS